MVNLYRNGNDSVAWHSDNEKEFGPEPVIASVSFGAKRMFHLRHKGTKERIKVLLEPGSVLLMGGRCQEEWHHAILKDSSKEPRINLTFRLAV